MAATEATKANALIRISFILISILGGGLIDIAPGLTRDNYTPSAAKIEAG